MWASTPRRVWRALLAGVAVAVCMPLTAAVVGTPFRWKQASQVFVSEDEQVRVVVLPGLASERRVAMLGPEALKSSWDEFCNSCGGFPGAVGRPLDPSRSFTMDEYLAHMRVIDAGSDSDELIAALLRDGVAVQSLPAGSAAVGLGYDPNRFRIEAVRLADGFGWPFTSMSAERRYFAVKCEPPYVEVLDTGLQLDRPYAMGPGAGLSFWEVWKPLPTEVEWLGFVANIATWGVFVAAADWSVHCALLKFRRRRGLCGNCGYPCKPANVCTECGKPS